MATKELWLIWRSSSPNNRSRYRIGTLQWDTENNTYTFFYNHDSDLDKAAQYGFTFFPGFDNLKQTYKNDSLFLNIASRLPNPNRDDYLDFLNRYNLDLSSNNFQILCATKGRQITDNFEFVPSFNEKKIEFDIAGVDHRHIVEIQNSVENGTLISGAKLILEREIDSKYDPAAIKVMLPARGKNIFLGYVPRYYSRKLAEKLDSGTDYSAVITRVDLTSKIKEEKISASVRLMFAS